MPEQFRPWFGFRGMSAGAAPFSVGEHARIAAA